MIGKELEKSNLVKCDADYNHLKLKREREREKERKKERKKEILNLIVGIV